MAGSCSSNKLNGCAVCAPSLVLFQLSASTSQGMVGKGCLNGDNPSPKKVYFSESSNASFNYNASDNIIDLSITDVASYNYNENITCFIDPYGAIIFTSTLSSSNSYNDFYSDEVDPGHTSAGSISCSKAERKSSCDSEPSTQCSLGGNCELNPAQGCPGDPEVGTVYKKSAMNLFRVLLALEVDQLMSLYQEEDLMAIYSLKVMELIVFKKRSVLQKVLVIFMVFVYLQLALK